MLQSHGQPGPGPRNAFRNLFARVAARCDLPPMPKVAVRAMSLVRDPDARVADVARIIAGDPAIAARFLRIARSPVYARRQTPATLEDAIGAVGFATLRQVLVVASARAAYRTSGPAVERLWEHGLVTALAADDLAQASGAPRGGPAFVAGLLHDIGRLVCHIADPVTYRSLGWCDGEAERDAFGEPHAAVGGCLADLWGLERPIVDAIMYHHVAEPSGLAAVVCAADWIAHELGIGSVPGPAGPPPPAAGVPGDLTTAMARVAERFEIERRYFD